jgi:hypothetical protein
MWTPAQMILSVRRWRETYDRWPTTTDFDTDRALPSRRTVTGHGLTLAALRRAAGARDGGDEGHGGRRGGGGWPKGQHAPPWGRARADDPDP